MVLPKMFIKQTRLHIVVGITAFPSSKSELSLLCHQEPRTKTESAPVNRNAVTGIAASIHLPRFVGPHRCEHDLPIRIHRSSHIAYDRLAHPRPS